MAVKKEVPEEVQEQVEKSLAKAQAPESGARTRTRKSGQSKAVVDPSVPIPDEVDIDAAGPAAFFVTPAGKITGYQDSQEFEVPEEMLKGLKFTPPGENLPKKRLYNIKGIHKDGRLNQFPLEDQINNQAGGDPGDLIGLRRYQRKGILLLIDWNSLLPVYCPAWGCWAKAEAEHYGFCSKRHAQHTMPNMYKDAGGIMEGMFAQGSTTTRTWEA